MDRRAFLKTTSAVTAAATATGVSAAAVAETVASTSDSMIVSPALATKTRTFIVARPLALDHLEITTAALRLAKRLEAAFGDNTRVIVQPTIEGGLEAVTTGLADFYFGLESQHASYHPAFHAFAGLPLGQHLDAARQHAWATENRDLWQELSGQFGVVAFPAGQTGQSPGLYAEKLFESAGDLKGARIAVSGLARTVLTTLGAIAVRDGADTPGSITAANLDAAEPLLTPFTTVAHWAYQPGLNPAGLMLSLGTRTSLWAKLTLGEQAIVEGIAADAYLAGQSAAIQRATNLDRLHAARRWPVHTGFPTSVQAALEQASAAAVDDVAAADPLARRIVDSHRAFRSGMDPWRLDFAVPSV
jgi:TRAP-type mannitol/chloroaromatic compound transport system substrate-binding protein